jgi:hypothetical protein
MHTLMQELDAEIDSIMDSLQGVTYLGYHPMFRRAQFLRAFRTGYEPFIALLCDIKFDQHGKAEYVDHRHIKGV